MSEKRINLTCINGLVRLKIHLSLFISFIFPLFLFSHLLIILQSKNTINVQLRRP